MIKVGTNAYCLDNTGVYFVKIICALGIMKRKELQLGDVALVSVKAVNNKAHFLKDERTKTKFRKGSIHRAIVVWNKNKLKRVNRSYLWFNKNGIILANKKLVPYGTKIPCKVPREVATRHPYIASLCTEII